MFKIRLTLLWKCWIILGVCERYLPTQARRERDADISYNPTHGYEPYWTNGEWMFEDDPITKSLPTTKWYKVCGEECNKLYDRIGKVCAHVSNVNNYESCRSHLHSLYCDGRDMDVLSSFVTFDHYCLFLDARCKSAWHSKLVLIHVGACVAQQEHFKPIYIAKEPIERMKQYMSRLVDLTEVTEPPPTKPIYYTTRKQ